MPTLVEAAGGAAEVDFKLPLDGVSQWPMLTKGAPSARTSLLVAIERDAPTTAINPSVAPPPSPPPGPLLPFKGRTISLNDRVGIVGAAAKPDAGETPA